jgi:uncharacterized protein (TIGR02217 family)
MSITILSDVIVPERFFVAGVTGRNVRRNERARVDSARMRINIAQEDTLRSFNFTNAPLTVDDWAEFEGLYEVTHAGAYGCLILDPKDQKATDWPVTLITGTTYQAIKRYTFTGSAQTHDRSIRRLHVASFVLKINGVVQSTPANYTFDEDTGVITIPSTPAASSVSWSGTFYVPVHFERDDIEWELVVAGPADGRRIAGQSIVLVEVHE